MKISLFSFLRNGVKLGYPFEESIQSAMPLADEFVIALGPSDADEQGGTRAVLQRLQAEHAKLRVIEVQWNETMKTKGFVYGQQKMLAQSQCSGDWAFYLEADEVLHEEDLDQIDTAMRRHLLNPSVEALVFDYHHFFGSPQWLAKSPGWYRRAPRIIRNNLRVVALDGLFWNVVESNQRLRWPRAALAQGRVFHYGHVRPIEAMNQKQHAVERYWDKAPKDFKRYDIDPEVLVRFEGRHPAVMASWLTVRANPDFQPDASHTLTSRERRHRMARQLENWFGLDLSRKHFRLVED